MFPLYWVTELNSTEQKKTESRGENDFLKTGVSGQLQLAETSACHQWLRGELLPAGCRGGESAGCGKEAWPSWLAGGRAGSQGPESQCAEAGRQTHVTWGRHQDCLPWMCPWMCCTDLAPAREQVFNPCWYHWCLVQSPAPKAPSFRNTRSKVEKAWGSSHPPRSLDFVL